MRSTLPIGTRVEIKSLVWGESDIPLYKENLIGMVGEVSGHDDDHYTPPNIIYVEEMGIAYFLPTECLEVIA